jgi:hypothetical protein
MRHNEEGTKKRLDGVPINNRVFIYNAQIIIEFLNATFMPTHFFFHEQGMKIFTPGGSLKPEMMKDPKVFEDEKYTLGEMYEFYKLYRQQKDYTSLIETRYKFSIILRKLDLLKNGWQFNFRRQTRAQFVYFAPVQLRVKVPLEIRKLYPCGLIDLNEGQVEVKPEDYDDVQPEDEKIGIDPAEPGEDKTVEVVTEGPKFVEVKVDEFKEEQFEIDVPVEPDTKDPTQFPASGEDLY